MTARSWRPETASDTAGVAVCNRPGLCDLLAAFFETKGQPETVAVVGGPTAVSSGLAETYPATRIVAVGDSRFEHAEHSSWAPDEQFELVLCDGPLWFVADPVAAIQELYDSVAPRGHLVCGYPNDHARALFQQWVEGPDQHPDPSFDPERFAKRFSRVLSGDSTLSYRQIRGALGTWPRSFGEITEPPDWPEYWEHVPLVWVPRW